MKKLLASLLALSLLLPLSAHAGVTRSPEFYFLSAVLQSVYQYEQGRMLLAGSDEEEGLDGQIRNMEKAVAEWQKGLSIVQPHLKDKLDSRRQLAAAIDSGLATFISHSQITIGLLKKAAGGEMPDEEETIEGGLDMEAAEDEALRRIEGKLSTYAPAGLTTQEKSLLVLRIDWLFAKQLKTYRLRPSLASTLIVAIVELENKLKAGSK